MTALHRAVTAPANSKAPAPNLDEVQRLLDEGADVTALDAHGRSVLDVAAISGDTTPAHEAASLEVMRLLVARGARATTASVYSPLSHFEVQLEAGAPIDARDARGDQLLHHAAASGRAAHARALLARRADLNAADGLGRTPLRRARDASTDPWVVPNGRVAGFVELLALLEQAGAVDEVALPVSDDPFAPVAIDMARVRALASTIDVGSSIARRLDDRFASVQALVSVLSDRGESTRVAFFRAIAPTWPRRDVAFGKDTTLTRPLFVNGDLVVDGHLTVRAALAVTGSVRVRGVVVDGGKVVFNRQHRLHRLGLEREVVVVPDDDLGSEDATDREVSVAVHGSAREVTADGHPRVVTRRWPTRRPGFTSVSTPTGRATPTAWRRASDHCSLTRWSTTTASSTTTRWSRCCAARARSTAGRAPFVRRGHHPSAHLVR